MEDRTSPVRKQPVGDAISTMRIVESYLKSMEGGTGKAKYLEKLEKLVNGLSRETFIFFDTETTGLDQHLDQITEIAAAAVKGPDFKIVDTMHGRAALSDKTYKRIEDQRAGIDVPDDPKFKTVEQILKMTRYHDNPAQARPELEILNEFKEFCAKHNGVIVGHNAEFDMRMVGTKVGKIPNRGVLDTMLFARFFFHPMLMALEEAGDEKAKEILTGVRDLKGKPKATLGMTLQALKIPIEGWHTSVADVESTVAAFRGILQYVQEHLETAETESYKKHQAEAFKRVRDYKLGPRSGNPGLNP